MRVPPTLRIIRWEIDQLHQNGVSWCKIAISLIEGFEGYGLITNTDHFQSEYHPGA